MANPPFPDLQAAIEALRERELTIENAWDASAEITAKVLDNEFGPIDENVKDHVDIWLFELADQVKKRLGLPD